MFLQNSNYIFVKIKFMKIEKFTKQEFGTLTTITSEKTGVTMFLAQEVAAMWGHTNITQSIKRILNDNEFKKIKRTQYPEFFENLVCNKLLRASSNVLIMISESAIYKLALASNLEKAKPFRNWVTSEVLPSIRKKGYYSLADQTGAMMIHTNVAIQKDNSKGINAKNMIEHGIESVIEYNRQSCLLHTGKTPSEIKEIGKQKGLKSIQRTSAKEVLRNIDAPVACAMSFTDSLTQRGFDLTTVSELSKKCAIPLFQGMKELGINLDEYK